jgi:hypothetical protein
MAERELRSRIASDVEESYEELFGNLIEEAKTAKKTVRVQCPHCHKVVYPEIDNVDEMRKTISFLTEHGFGRAPASQGEQGQGVTVIYKVVLPGDDDEQSELES